MDSIIIFNGFSFFNDFRRKQKHQMNSSVLLWLEISKEFLTIIWVFDYRLKLSSDVQSGIMSWEWTQYCLNDYIMKKLNYIIDYTYSQWLKQMFSLLNQSLLLTFYKMLTIQDQSRSSLSIKIYNLFFFILYLDCIYSQRYSQVPLDSPGLEQFKDGSRNFGANFCNDFLEKFKCFKNFYNFC